MKGCDMREASASGRSRPTVRRLPKASEILAEQLRSQILGNELAPGTSLPAEAEIIEQYEFSRGTVREALRLLEVEGLIVIKRGPHGGIRVSHPDISQVSRTLAVHFATAATKLRDFFAFRLLVEPAVAADAARTATTEQKALLLRAVEDLPATPRPELGDAPDFHRVVGDCSNNGVYRVLMAAMHEVLERHAHGEQLSPDDVSATAKAHQAIARAIVSGDVAGAEKVMYRHIKEFRDVLDRQGRLDERIITPRRW
jgi:DNA-binding FadR family transcriptional regulator